MKVHIGSFLKKRRKEMRKNQQSIAKEIERCQSYVSKAERKQNPAGGFYTFLKWLEILSVSPEEIRALLREGKEDATS